MSANSNRPRLVAVVNSSIAVGFLQGQLEFFKSKGFDVTLLCPERRKDEWDVARPDGVSIINIPMERGISPVRDLVSLYRLWRIVHELRPAITNVGTPKAGLLGGFVAWLNRVPCRFYTLHGLRFETTRGLKRRLLICAECLACRFAHRVICVSKSVREKAIASGLAARARTSVLGSGSCNGVDTSRFAATPEVVKRAADLRHQLGIPAQAPVVLFVGRLTRDKGIPELLEAFQKLNHQFSEARLLFVGCFEDGDPLPVDVRKRLEIHPRVILAGAANDTASYYALADVVVLPSHREGLPTVVLEAHAAGKPVVAASATGIVDLIVHGETGLLFPIGDARALADAMTRLVIDKALAHRLALAGLEQVKRNFRQEQVWQALLGEYLEVLQWRESPRSSILPQPEN